MYLYKEDGQFDSAVKTMIDHCVCFNHELFLDCVKKVRPSRKRTVRPSVRRRESASFTKSLSVRPSFCLVWFGMISPPCFGWDVGVGRPRIVAKPCFGWDLDAGRPQIIGWHRYRDGMISQPCFGVDVDVGRSHITGWHRCRDLLLVKVSQLFRIVAILQPFYFFIFMLSRAYDIRHSKCTCSVAIKVLCFFTLVLDNFTLACFNF